MAEEETDPKKHKSLTIDDKAVEEYIKYTHPDKKRERLDIHYDIHMQTMNPVTTFLEELEKKRKAEDEKWTFKKLDDKDVFDVIGQYLFNFLDKLKGKAISDTYRSDFDKLDKDQKATILSTLTRMHFGDHEGEFLKTLVGRVRNAAEQGESRLGIKNLIDSIGKTYVGKKELGGEEKLYGVESMDRYAEAFGKKDAGVIMKYISDPSNKHFADVFKPYEVDGKKRHLFEKLHELEPRKAQELIHHLIGHKHGHVGAMGKEAVADYYLKLKGVDYQSSEK